jgi:enoyl-CoA hydratase/carnithine racemase
MPGAAGTQNLPRGWRAPCQGAGADGDAVHGRAGAGVARQVKKALDKATELDRMSGYAFEIEAYNRTIPTEDRQEGINAFNEKRKPKYKGR